MAQSFGSIVHKVRFAMNWDSSPTDGDHHQRSRQAVSDERGEIRSEDLGFNRFEVDFTPDASSSSAALDGIDPLGQRLWSIKKLWYKNTNGHLIPKEGVDRVHYDVLTQHLSTFEGADHDHIDMWTVYDELLQWAPQVDGTFNIVLDALRQPLLFTYQWDGSDWKYLIDGAIIEDIDLETDPTGRFFDLASDRLVQGALFRLKSTSENADEESIRRTARMVNKAEERIDHERDVADGPVRNRPYLL